MENLRKADHGEGKVAEAIEEQTSKLPSDIFLWASLGIMGVSLAMKIMGRNTPRCLSGSGPRLFY